MNSKLIVKDVKSQEDTERVHWLKSLCSNCLWHRERQFYLDCNVQIYAGNRGFGLRARRINYIQANDKYSDAHDLILSNF
ncbi:hypothetical protein Cylst_4510 [Cylindrospermum stagnale PCC 7417]|uniref:Uncharacterized protein n=1 Tax=Cylindrospermum stagnale PCC 7417 TaxID=56107 RepID=K9X2D1_9NOST|nr:hypothetical protein [Cylindrospermum stagnale]AFZ26588.1 hypothetical protein Cylst_4510 [Cylindrospermum stagnale PCC 7417]